MYHSITFYSPDGFWDGAHSKNSYTDLLLIGTSPPVIAMPSQKTKYLDIPGADGVIDLSDLLTGGPIFNNREGSLEFYTRRFVRSNDYGTEEGFVTSSLVYRKVSRLIHGRRLQMILEDDPNHYYEGRFTVDYATGDGRGILTINYNLDPYRRTCTVVDDTIEDGGGRTL